MSQIALADMVTNASPHTAPAGNKIKSHNKKVESVFSWKILCHWVATQGGKISLQARLKNAVASMPSAQFSSPSPTCTPCCVAAHSRGKP